MAGITDEPREEVWISAGALILFERKFSEAERIFFAEGVEDNGSSSFNFRADSSPSIRVLPFISSSPNPPMRDAESDDETEADKLTVRREAGAEISALM